MNDWIWCVCVRDKDCRAINLICFSRIIFVEEVFRLFCAIVCRKKIWFVSFFVEDRSGKKNKKLSNTKNFQVDSGY